MKILVCGSRTFSLRSVVKDTLLYFDEENPEIIHGGCRGADSLANEVAGELGYECTVCPADWDKHGKAAGPIRNQQMIDTNPDLVIAFLEYGVESRGTSDCIKRAQKADIEVMEVTVRPQGSDEGSRMAAVRDYFLHVTEEEFFRGLQRAGIPWERITELVDGEENLQ